MACLHRHAGVQHNLLLTVLWIARFDIDFIDHRTGFIVANRQTTAIRPIEEGLGGIFNA